MGTCGSKRAGNMNEQIVSEQRICPNQDCTVLDTGVCLEGHVDFTTECPYYQEQDKETEETEERELLISDKSITAETQPTLEKEPGRQFWSGVELGLDEAEHIMRTKYTRLIGIIGLSGVGKTCFLNSLYLKISSHVDPLTTYRFAGSKSLYGFEERVWYTRQWTDGQIPEKLSERTRLQNPRQPGFMHLRLTEVNKFKNDYEILFTDLPGEWFESVLDSSIKSDRLMFLRRADGLLFFTDAERLVNQQSHHQEVQQACLLIARLKETIGIDASIPFILVVSKIDVMQMSLSDGIVVPGVEQIVEEANAQGFNLSVVYAASFSRCPNLIPNAYGIEDILSRVLTNQQISSQLETPLLNLEPYSRAIGMYQGDIKLRMRHER